ncbi:ephrin type-B receptor 1-B-like [Sycon ciliatum]|uniref:ephrin type-B receptor 1-B-like n=1 Tax=Sycon ciliatum TaxID=27933 RepID=UPI0031F6A22E
MAQPVQHPLHMPVAPVLVLLVLVMHCAVCPIPGVLGLKTPTLAVANGTLRYVDPLCTTFPATDVIQRNTRLIYDTSLRSFLVFVAPIWTVFNLGSTDTKQAWGHTGVVCDPGFMVCHENVVGVQRIIVSPYIGDMSAFAPTGGVRALSVRLIYRMSCSFSPPCSHNVVNVLAWPVASNQTITSAAYGRFTKFAELNATAAQFGSQLMNSPPIMETLYYPVPLKTGGVYLAFETIGACISIDRVAISYHICVETLFSSSKIEMPETVSRSVSQRVVGRCDPSQFLQADSNVSGGVVSAECTREGHWILGSVVGRCVCLPGFGRTDRAALCLPCTTGMYKGTQGDVACRACPAKSDSGNQALRCGCMSGYYRDETSGAPNFDDPCQEPPRQLDTAQLATDNVTARSLEISWSSTTMDGGRSDVTYEVLYRESENDAPWMELASSIGSPSLSASITGLKPFTNYTVRVFVRNGVSDEAGLNSSFVGTSVVLLTGEAAPGLPRDVMLTQLARGIRVVFSPPAEPNGIIRGYMVVLREVGGTHNYNRNVSGNAQWADFLNLTDTAISYRAEVGAYTVAGFGRFGVSVNSATPGEADFTPSPTGLTTAPLASTPPSSSTLDLSVVVGAVCGGIIFVVFCLIIIIAIVYHKRRPASRYVVKVSRSSSSGVEGGSASILRHRTLSLRSTDTSNYTPPTGPTSQLSPTPSNRQFVDPTIYHDVTQALNDFTQEVNPNFVVLKKPIGEGEFAHVHRGELKIPGKGSKPVAVKVLKSGADHNVKKDFLMEACILGQFQCPNIIALMGICSKDRTRPAMILTEFMENGSLDHYLQLQTNENNLKPKELVAMARDAARGMEYLSNMNFIHRDLAARNILVSKTRECKVSDFGLSREADDDNAYEVKHGGKLPIRWTAPEAIQFRKFTTASDVWSFGILLWEIMSYGERPYWDWGNSKVMDAITQHKYRLPPPSGCPTIVHALMLECWNKDRTQRPTFPQIRTKIERLLEGQLQVENVHTANVSHDAPISPYSTIEDWLKHLLLSQYAESFASLGYAQVSQCQEVGVEDLEMLGVVSPAHQRKILNSLAAMRGDYSAMAAQ